MNTTLDAARKRLHNQTLDATTLTRYALHNRDCVSG